MSHETPQIAAQTQWVGDVKAQLQKLNVLLAQVPPGIDVKAVADKTLVQAPSDDVKEVWKITLNATRTEILI